MWIKEPGKSVFREQICLHKEEYQIDYQKCGQEGCCLDVPSLLRVLEKIGADRDRKMTISDNNFVDKKLLTFTIDYNFVIQLPLLLYTFNCLSTH